MQILKKRLSGIVMAACLLVALACAPQVALAAAELPAEGVNTLTVAPINTTDEAVSADIAKANVVVDVYKVADAVPNASNTAYTYTLIAPFGSGELDYSEMDADDWMTLAAEAAKLVTADMDHLTVPADDATKLALPGDGLFLIMPHGKDVKLSYGSNVASTFTATGEKYAYSFLPSLVVAPSKEADADDAISTAGDGPWLRDIHIVIKPAYEPIPPDDVTPPPDNPPDKTTPPSGGKGVKTGDSTNLLPFYVTMAASGMLLALIAFNTIRRRKAERTDVAGKGDA